MRILLDDVPWPMHKLLSGHASSTAQDLGWAGIKNGDLLHRAEGEFEFSSRPIKTFNTSRTSPGDALQFSNSQPTTLAAFKRLAH